MTKVGTTHIWGIVNVDGVIYSNGVFPVHDEVGNVIGHCTIDPDGKVQGTVYFKDDEDLPRELPTENA